MLASEITKLGLSIEHETEVKGKKRWVAHAEDQSKPLLILEVGSGYFAIPLFCSHAHASLLEAKLTSSGKLICPKHGQETDILNGSGQEVIREGDSFYLKHSAAIPTVNLESGLCSADDSDETEVLKTVNTALQKKVLSNLESMDLMLSQVEHQKVELEENNLDLLSINELIGSIMNSIEEFIIVTDNVGRITRVNRYAAEILNVKPDDLIGVSPDELLNQNDLNQLVQQFPEKNWDQRPYIYRAVYRERGFEKEVRFKGPADGTENNNKHTFLLRGTLLFSHKGKEEGLILSATDISVIKQQEKLKRQKDIEKHLQLLQSTLASISYGVAMFDKEGRILTSNRLFDELVNMPERTTHSSIHFSEIFRSAEENPHDQLPPYKSLSERNQSWTLNTALGLIIDFDSRPSHTGGFVVTACDVTEKRRIDEHIHLLSSTVEQSDSEIIITDTEGIIVYVNPMFTENTGYLATEAIGRKSSIVKSGEMSEQFYKDLWHTIKQEHQWKGEVINRKKSGQKFWQSMSITPIYDSNGNVTHYLSSKSDITKQKEAENQLRYQAEHDLLTRLPNRPVLLAEMEKSISAARDEQRASAILFMDLDNFKAVNDTLGHINGDFLLQLVAKRLNQCIENTDIIARLGGDEFAIIQNGIKDRNEPAVLADKLIKAITAPFQVEGHLLHIGISIGITLLPEDGLNSSTLLSNADIAMYEAKAITGSQYKFFDYTLQQNIKRKRQIESLLHSAMEKDELNLVFQPKIDIKTGSMVGAEVLLRWHNDQLGFVSPAEFIPIAELSGLIIDLGAWVLHKTLRYLEEWQQYDFELPKIAVNLSAVQLRDVNLVEDINRALNRYQIKPDAIELEITETATMSDTEFSMQQLNNLKKLGISLALDDFGTGYSSLSYLASMPIDRIKIDRAFVNDIQHSKQAKAIIESIIHLGKIMSKTVIAEGVEEEAQLNLLKDLGCDEAQGYLISKPIMADELVNLLIETNKGLT